MDNVPHNPNPWGDLPDLSTPPRPQAALAPARKTAPPAQHAFDRFLEDFISGREPQTTQWIRLASLVASHSFSCDIVVRVLRPKENVASGNLPLDKLGTSLARKVGAKYTPGRLRRIAGGLDSFVYDPDNPDVPPEVYSFDRSFLPATVRILVIGDLETPAATLDAIRKAILAELPKAEVKSFTLQWLEGHLQNAPLDDRYFLSHESPLSVLSREANPHHPVGRAEPEEVEEPTEEATVDVSEQIAPEPPVQEVSVKQKSGRKTKPKMHHRHAPAPPKNAGPVVTERAPALTTKGSPRLRRGSLLTVVFIGFVVVAVAAGVYVNSRGFLQKGGAAPDVLALPELEAQPPPEPPKETPVPVARPAVAQKARGSQGVITVPSAGLRSGPSLTAKPLRKSVRNNERVTILKRKPSSAGPDWIQIETRSGTVGWVWASVVRPAGKSK